MREVAVESQDGTDRRERIEQVLRARFAPLRLVVADESALHAGHAGARAGGQTHYRVAMVAEGFAGMGRVARAREVNAALAGEFEAGLHALATELRAPGEAGSLDAGSRDSGSRDLGSLGGAGTGRPE